MKHERGFTLVEIAIVLMIIGLLIGGILKGQELITNARVLMTVQQVRSIDAAVLTFQGSYGALPGDIRSPSTRLPNCTTSPCSIGGNGNGIPGPVYPTDGGVHVSDEQGTFWLHLAVANMVGGIDTSKTWASGDSLNASYPNIPVGGQMVILNYNITSGLNTGYNGNILHSWGTGNGAINYQPISLSLIARIDRKMDDGRPWNGDVRVDNGGCGVDASATEYDANNTSLCAIAFKTSF